jgi:hypothetical protein
VEQGPQVRWRLAHCDRRFLLGFHSRGLQLCTFRSGTHAGRGVAALWHKSGAACRRDSVFPTQLGCRSWLGVGANDKQARTDQQTERVTNHLAICGSSAIAVRWIHLSTLAPCSGCRCEGRSAASNHPSLSSMCGKQGHTKLGTQFRKDLGPQPAGPSSGGAMSVWVWGRAQAIGQVPHHHKGHPDCTLCDTLRRVIASTDVLDRWRPNQGSIPMRLMRVSAKGIQMRRLTCHRRLRRWTC